MDFFKIKESPGKKTTNVTVNFLVGRSKDFMVRGKSFYAIWDDDRKLWSTNEFDVQRLIDNKIDEYIKDRMEHNPEGSYTPLYLRDFRSNGWKEYRTFLAHMPDTNKQLDSKLVFLSSEGKRSDYSSKRLPYDMVAGPCPCYNELLGTLFQPEERQKLEWAVGSIFAGDSKEIQKFVILYGEGGTGKSTFLNIVQQLFVGYYIAFDAKSMTGNSNGFSVEVFKSDPLVGIQHDGDLSRIADNTKLNSIVSHEIMQINEKFKPPYMARANTFLFMGTNSPVHITDAQSGIIRRLIDVYPSGNKVPTKRYYTLMDGIGFELGQIAQHCLDVYRHLGKNYYGSYKPMGMMYRTDFFYNFVEENYFLFCDQDGTTLKQAYELYKVYCGDSGLQVKLPKYKFKSELFSYFKTFEERFRDGDGHQARNIYKGFLKEKFTVAAPVVEEHPISLVLDSSESALDSICRDCPAQYANAEGTPTLKWENVKTSLKDLDTKKLHYVQLSPNHIVIDFDLKKDGEKSLERNLEAASSWPKTYTEFSKSGAGLHLHYIYDGDPTKLERLYSEGIEIKVFSGNASLRRKLTKCNRWEQPITHISTGLPLLPVKEGKVLNLTSVKSERALRDLIIRNLNKEFHPGTKPSIDFIFKILEDAYKGGLIYDLTSLRTNVLNFAAQSSNQSDYCIKLVAKMKFASEEKVVSNLPNGDSDEIVFYDVEVFPNLFLVVWKHLGPDKRKVAMINPSPEEIEKLMQMRLVGFNNRRYDNHILYARWLGYTNEQLYQLSKKIISGSSNVGMFREGYNLSYTDIFDFSSKKQSLKKFEIELEIHHLELGFDWDKDVPEDLWPKVIEYCENDVVATEAVFLARREDWNARLILSKLSGLTPNCTTQQHTAKIIFGNDQNPQKKFVYTDLSERFPGYSYDPTRTPKSLYRGEDPSEGGYVYAEPGIYTNVAVLDVASEHPTSLIELNLFGDEYTRNFKGLLDARLAIKRRDYDKARTMLNGVLIPYLEDQGTAKALAYALKIVINIVYGLTSASFENKFNDPRNKDNIVAKRGALFMIDLKNAVQARGFSAIHIKTDSIKIPNATPEIIEFVMNFGLEYGYSFEHETTYEKFALVNNAVYIAKTVEGLWEATGAQFAHPYVFKKLFSKEPLAFEDYCETKEVKTGLYLDFNEQTGGHNYVFVGKVGSFIPVLKGAGGGELFRIKDGKYYAATRTKGWRWLEAETVKALPEKSIIDLSYFDLLAEDAIKTIAAFGDFNDFVS